MKSIEGILRYDVLDAESWCFDMGYQMINVFSGMEVHLLIDDQFLQGKLVEIPHGGLSVVFDGNRKGRQWSYVLERGRRYPAKMGEEAVEKILDEFRCLEI
ncbi:hypothetical protein NZD89_14330 [Alicyclobacillus fastidiosus]|uniref:Uncharacterized protein n=1 Tax=Alicyclobacillus fastidiosus TaxID=392011 RepID=A0ABY6Z9N5_9BACL|nr:hypothetical protein [Alicyclobacillus fastidiosus]WAH39600.1 hypothetical protein NZD89_14330 [Alicyclobacillus fastidiosus]